MLHSSLKVQKLFNLYETLAIEESLLAIHSTNNYVIVFALRGEY
jgi:hypothetical protein